MVSPAKLSAAGKPPESEWEFRDVENPLDLLVGIARLGVGAVVHGPAKDLGLVDRIREAAAAGAVRAGVNVMEFAIGHPPSCDAAVIVEVDSAYNLAANDHVALAVRARVERRAVVPSGSIAMFYPAGMFEFILIGLVKTTDIAEWLARAAEQLAGAIGSSIRSRGGEGEPSSTAAA